MNALKETADTLSSTGPQAALAGAGAEAIAGGLTLNTKPLFKLMVEKQASDLFFTSNAPIKIKIEGQILAVNKQVLTPETVKQTAYALMTNPQRAPAGRPSTTPVLNPKRAPALKPAQV